MSFQHPTEVGRYLWAYLEFRRQLSPRWSLSANFNHTQKRYADENIAQRYNDYLNGLYASLSYDILQNWLVFGSVEVSKS